MKYVIMAAGKGTRWNNYLGITKQEAVINNESILERIVRLILEKDSNAKIIILSNNKNHFVNNAILHSPEYSDNYRSKYAYELIDEPMIYLYGDTFYERDSINKILEPNNTEILFYGNSKAIVGLRVNDYEMFKNGINSFNGSGSLYRFFKNTLSNNEEKYFMNIGNEFYNINYGEDYVRLKEIEEKLFFDKTLLCSGVIWNIGLKYKDSIISDLEKNYKINHLKLINAGENLYDFFVNLYDGYISQDNIDGKYLSIGKYEPIFASFDFEVSLPHFELQQKKNQIACLEISKLKKEIRNKYKLQTGSKYDNVLHITDTPIEYLNNQIVISNYIQNSKVKVLKK